jgi:uncharacterized membrane protein YphA (DoxX/SURF4 family)
LLRIIFGFVWALDAYFKWLPGFFSQFVDYLSSAAKDQPTWIQAWITFWIRWVKVDPHVFAHVTAIGETAVALGLIFGIFSNLTYLGGVLLSLVIWTTAEGFGGPYQAGSTDIGAAIIYVIVFAGLFLSNAGRIWGLDPALSPHLGRWAWLASGQDRETRAAPRPTMSRQLG